MFVDPNEKVPISDGKNTIYIRAKMSVGVRAKVEDAIAMADGGTAKNIGSYILALLENNILAWEGPDFEGVPCTVENIRRLDPDDPLVQKVRDEIARRNAPRGN